MSNAEMILAYAIGAPIVFLFLLYQVIRNAVKWGIRDADELRRAAGNGPAGTGEPTS